MEAKKKKNLQSKGWVVGDVDEFLDLDQADLAIIDMKLALADTIVQKRKALKMTQATLAEAIGSSQSRIAKVEHGDPSVSLEMMMRALIGLGSSRQEIGRAIG
ncbi:Helix-turn-helix [Desulfonatronum thiosulfatophilum]|uniref:Helix-turn-helix n=1 Tax=Desulfonatronum thiosulfatophilum TaxID=617002 RepID=A0A1G6EX00_9BACT|nr:helix-turn-helix domain-containing protein [Desulfonatronum thiosulfatophilum]SDB61977.1 Helix-turn-helix [Desulfonatronum thiosulfatophilum]